MSGRRLRTVIVEDLNYSILIDGKTAGEPCKETSEGTVRRRWSWLDRCVAEARVCPCR